jgi:hypothetical protein
MSRVSRFNISNRKKGILALEALIGTILSVIALVVLVGFFADLLPQSNNLKIAEENTQSIVDFVNYFQTDSNYKSLDNCFNILKLNYQTNFQYSEEGKENYFYIIAEDGVYITPFSNIAQFYDDVDSSSIELNKYRKIDSFDNPIELYYDNTDKTNWNILSTIIFVNDELNIELEDLANIHDSSYDSFYFLKPNIVDLGDKIVSYLPFSSKESNNYEVSVPENEVVLSDDLEYLSEPHYLVYSNVNQYGKPILFVTNSKYVLPQVKNNLCSHKYFSKLQLESFYENPNNIEKVDYNNNEILFDELIGTNGEIYSFSWKNGPICKLNEVKNDCGNILNLNNVGYYSDNNLVITFKDFIIETKNFFKNNPVQLISENTGLIENWGIKEVIPLTKEEVLKSKVYFTDIFTKLDQEKYDVNLLNNNDYLSKNNFFDITQINNDNINGCENTLCNLLKFDNTKIYSYTGGLKETGLFLKSIGDLNTLKYYSFNELFLRKDQVEFQGNEYTNIIYFNGKKIQYDVFTPEQKGLYIPFYDDPEQEQLVYRFTLDNIIKEGKLVSIEVFLSSYQFRKIPKYQLKEEIK